MDKKRVLIFPAGTEIAFEIVNALKYSKFVELYGGTSVDDHSEFVFKNLITGFPFVDNPEFLKFLNKVVSDNNIDCIYPAHDSVSVFLSEHADEINGQVIITDKETTRICRSKKETYKYFEGFDFIPKTYSCVENVDSYPVFVKPSIGQGSVGAKKVECEEELISAINNDSSLVICEYLPEMEYTVDCFTDKNGNLRVSKLRDRQRIRSGISVRSSSHSDDVDIQKIATIINDKLHFIGAWFFQVKKNLHGEYKLLEISPRIPGTMGLSRNLGINFPMLTLFAFWGYDVDIIDNGYDILLDRAFINRYKISINYGTVYMDFDDTVYVDDKVNLLVISFLYQCVNQGKKIVLLTKHAKDIYESLKKLKVSEGLFDEIVHIPEDADKSTFITEKDSIFIDDSFAERKNIKDKCDIPVFDLDMVEVLIDWRC